MGRGCFRITVAVLPSLDSLVPLARRAPVRVAGREEEEEDDGVGLMAAVTVAPRFLRAAAAAVADDDVVLAPVEVVIVLRAAVDDDVAVVVGRVVDRAPSTILLRMLVATTALPGVTAGRAMPDLPGVATVLGANREFEVVGDRTCAGLLRARSVAAGWARIIFFCGVWTSFSLSPPEISWLSGH
jgi:hypothetical protein